jgi:hypothetical protein
MSESSTSVNLKIPVYKVHSNEDPSIISYLFDTLYSARQYARNKGVEKCVIQQVHVNPYRSDLQFCMRKINPEKQRKQNDRSRYVNRR